MISLMLYSVFCFFFVFSEYGIHMKKCLEIFWLGEASKCLDVHVHYTHQHYALNL